MMRRFASWRSSDPLSLGPADRGPARFAGRGVRRCPGTPRPRGSRSRGGSTSHDLRRGGPLPGSRLESAALMHSLVMNHPFVDGKRVGARWRWRFYSSTGARSRDRRKSSSRSLSPLPAERSTLRASPSGSGSGSPAIGVSPDSLTCLPSSAPPAPPAPPFRPPAQDPRGAGSFPAPRAPA